jgi:hypothetical protein
MVVRSVVLAVSVLAVSAFGQNSVSASVSATSIRGSARFAAPPPFRGVVVTGAPYSGEEVSEQNQTLLDGTHISHKNQPEKVFRDSLGRTRRERAMFPGRPMSPDGTQAPGVIEIIDPVANVKLTFDPVNKVAHRQELPAAPQRMPVRGQVTQVAPAAAMTLGGGGGGVATGVVTGNFSTAPGFSPAGRMMPQMQNAPEKLGNRSIEGVTAEGTRMTMTWPVGAVDNDRPISAITETWFSTDLRLVILSTSSDPRTGEHVQKLINISRAEPAGSLFQAPPDYTVVDEKDGFTITWGGTPQQ